MAQQLTVRPPSDAAEEIERFAVATRVAHWALAAAFFVLLLTGLTNFWPEAKATQVADVRLFAWVHVVFGFASLGSLALLIVALLARRASVREDARELGRVGLDDYLWVQHQALSAMGSESQPPRAGKFNAGQKLNTLVSAGGLALLFGTGFVLGVNYFSKDVFTIGLVEQLFRWHTVVSLLLIPAVLGHLYLAIVHPSTRESLRGITRGRVRRVWARAHHPSWVEAVEAVEAQEARRAQRRAEGSD